jgi:hypothetical protein
MALKDSRSGRWWSRFHFVIRLLGITGLAAVLVGLTVLLIDEITWEAAVAYWAMLQAAVQGQSQQYPRRAFLLFMAGAVVVLFWLFLEALIIIRLVAGRRSATGFSTVVQIALATALLIGVNVYSYQHYHIFDLTSDHRFTLPTEPVNVPAELAKLNDETTILVYMRHKTFGPLSDKPDAYDFAAERKVVEKVKDLADLFREFGKQFKVEVLEIEEDGYDAKRDRILGGLADEAVKRRPGSGDLSDEERKKEVKKKTDELRERVEGVPENSIFFFAGDRVQRLTFNDFYQLDKTASKEAGGGRGNLVLLYQGIGPFARRALDIDQRRPRVGVATIHELLSTEGAGEIGHAGLKKALQANGFEVRDIILKRENPNSGELEAAVYTYDESRSETLREKIEAIDEQNEAVEETLKGYQKLLKRWRSASVEDLTKEFARELKGRKVTEELRQDQVEFFKEVIDALEVRLNRNREERATAVKVRAGLSDEQLQEQQRLTDLKARLDRQLADIDLLILPRTTFLNVLANWRIRNEYHHLDKAHVDAIRQYLKNGKPLLAMFGPSNEPSPRPGMPGGADADEVERMLGELGIQFGNSVVFYNVESDGFAARRSGLRGAGLNVDLPPVAFQWSPTALRIPGTIAEQTALPPNPLGASMEIIERSVGGQKLNIPARHARPVRFDPRRFGELKFDPVFMVTSADSWNDDNPFPTQQRMPHYEKPKHDDPRSGTFDMPRTGPFPVGVAVEEKVPAEWYSDKAAAPATVRLAVIGDGTMFLDRELTPARERLLVTTCNWLVGRDDLLPRDDQRWEYPRVELPPREQSLWKWGAWFGPPLLFAYLGLVVVLVRRLR